jgi:hypothetical protein
VVVLEVGAFEGHPREEGGLLGSGGDLVLGEGGDERRNGLRGRGTFGGEGRVGAGAGGRCDGDELRDWVRSAREEVWRRGERGGEGE